ncbi:MAG: MFS transporter [Legionellaceae bacterium]|nr:MFS transporter [Legionellaceae bacterium]
MITENKVTLSGTIVWLVCTLFFLYEFLLRTVLGTFQSPIMDELHLTPVQFAFLSSTVFQLIYGVMQIPVGIFADNFGLKKTLLSAVILCTVANLGFSLAHNFTVAILFRMLMGLGASCGFICLLIAIYDWMPRKNIAFFVGISQFIGTIGPMMAAGPLSSASYVSTVSWRDVFFTLSLIGLVITILVFLYVDNNRSQRSKFIILSHSTSLLTSLGNLIKQKQIWFIAIYSAFIYFSIEYLTENEGVAFLVQKGFSQTFSSYMITVAWLGYAISCPLLGYFSDKSQRRKPFMLISSLTILFSLIIIIYLPIKKELLLICFALLGVGAGGSSIGFAIMAEHCKEASLAAGLALNNTMIVISSAVNAPLIGYVLSRSSTVKMQLLNYQEAFIIMVLLAISATLIVIFYIKETFCKSTCNNTILTLKEKPSLYMDTLLSTET